MNTPASYGQSFNASVGVIWERIFDSFWEDVETVEWPDARRDMTFGARYGRSVLSVSRTRPRTLVTVRGPFLSCVVVPGEERQLEFDPAELSSQIFEMLTAFEATT